MKDWFKALFGYTAGNILSVLSFVFAAAVFYTVFWLYGVETEPVLYATLISAVILLIVFVLRFSSVYKKHKRLEKIKNDAEYFEKGFTGFNGREDKKSTGIGLFLCKKILTKLSHTITVTSEVGKGTAVKLGLDTVSLGVE